MKKILIILAVFSLTACMRVETGHVGVRTTFNGTVEQNPLPVGFHQSLVGHVTTYVANEITMTLDELHPQTKDKSILSDLEMSYTYSVLPTAIPGLVVKYKGRDLVIADEHYPLAAYINSVVTTATTDVFAQYNALDANDKREEIRLLIIQRVRSILAEEKIHEILMIHQIFIKNLQIDKRLQDSALAVISAQNELKAKSFQVQTAELEAERLSALAKNPTNIDYMNAKANSDIAEAIKDGKVGTIVIPHDFRGMIQLKQQ